MASSKAVQEVTQQLDALADDAIAEHSQRFFRTGPGEYGEGDQFLGIRVPELRKVARQHRGISERDVKALLKSKWHETRLLALLILVLQFNKGDDTERQKIFELYLAHTKHVNNWDLVDCSAHYIVGGQLFGQDQSLLDELAQSEILWERRIAIIATYYDIKQDEFAATLRISDQLLHDEEDLIHKAVGWMLREVGKRDQKVEEKFLKPRYDSMPRTMLRYAIEKFPEKLRKRYLAGKV